MAQIGPFSEVQIFLLSCITSFKKTSKFKKLRVFQKIQEICTKIGTRILKIDQEMTEKIELKVGNSPKNKAENRPI